MALPWNNAIKLFGITILPGGKVVVYVYNTLLRTIEGNEQIFSADDGEGMEHERK